MQRHPVQHQPNVCRLRAAVSDEYPPVDGFIDLAPEDDVALIAGEEVGPGFVVRRLVQLYTENVSVIQHYQPQQSTFSNEQARLAHGTPITFRTKSEVLKSRILDWIIKATNIVVQRVGHGEGYRCSVGVDVDRFYV